MFMSKKKLFIICSFFISLSSMEKNNSTEIKDRTALFLPCYLGEQYNLAESIVFLPNGNIQAQFTDDLTVEYDESGRMIQKTPKKTVLSVTTSLVASQEKAASKKAAPKSNHWV